MSAAHHDPTVPKGALMFAGGLVAFALVATTAVRVGLLPVAASPVAIRTATHETPLQTRDLTFRDRADGAVTITDVTTGKPAEVIEPGSKSGFIRGVMRGLARERRMHHVGDGPAFRLASWPDGGLSLTDTATGRVIELGAFGPTNRAAFASLLRTPTA